MAAPILTVAPAEGKKHFLVIGAGSSGLVVMRELTALGHSVSCFESSAVLGGVYAKTYDNTILTTSSLLTAYAEFSDGREDCPKFWTAEEYLDYMRGYAERFGLLRHVSFSTKVVKIQRMPETGRWTAWAQRCSPADAAPNEEEEEAVQEIAGFNGICICTGTNTWSCRPKFDGEEQFQGQIIHSECYKTPSDFAGKRVLVVGAGESGSDICNEISRHAAATGMGIRRKHGHIIPRVQRHGRVTDLNTNRCRYSNPYVLGAWVGWANQHAKRLSLCLARDTPETRVLAKVSELNLRQGTSAFSKFGCKNAGFVEAVVCRGATLHRGAFRLDAAGAAFADGSRFDCDAIVACTGYRNAFPFADETHPDIGEYGRAPRMLYKQVFHPLYGGEVGYFGFARPAFGSLPPTAEMQARLFALVANGDVALPDAKAMSDAAARDGAEWERRFGDDQRVKGLVDFQIYLDDLARQMGVLPPLRRLFLTRPRVWLKVMFGPFTTHQYRLRGPGADAARALDVYSRQPVGDLLESTITAAFLLAAKVLSLVGFRQLTPNNF
ncbi:flavin-binding monooxygenase-like subfamily [Tribonema minus]|uniref:Flavin-binding monooxygenase-like subfamily n=1 Tax=Tribonema minus TaxID=303371 RepID=A0A836C7U5_9STRA|nr:flavin-binding monooxygenase-like subfamily [Tribonema minus]